MTNTMSGTDLSLRSLRDRPFELLKELEKRSRAVTAAREETREVLGYPAVVTRIPGAKSWVKGLANVRGQLLPMLDLRQFLGSGATASGRNTRVVVVNHREIPAGLMVDEVLGFRRFAEAEFNAEAPPTVIRCDSYLAGAFRRGGEVWPVLSLKSLVESQSFLQAAS